LQVNSDAGLGYSTAALTLGSGSLQCGGSFTLGSSRGTVLVQSSEFVIDTNSYNLTIGNVIADGSSSGGIKKKGNGTLTLSGSNTYSEGTIISNGTLAISSSQNIGTGTTLTLNGGTLQAGASFSLPSSLSIVVDASSVINTNGYNLTIHGNFSGSDPLEKTGSGTLTLAGTNSSYTGTITISGGGISLSTGSNLWAGPLALSGGELIATGSFTFSQNATLSGANTIDVASGCNLVITGNISGTGGSLTKIDSGTLTLSGSNTYTGGTTISAGTLAVPAASGLGSGNLSLNGGTLQANGSFTFTYPVAVSSASAISVNSGSTLSLSGVLSGSENLTVGGGGALSLSNTGNTYSGKMTVNSGGLQVAASSLPPLANLVLDSGGALTVSGSNTVKTISGAGGITLNSGGTIIITDGNGNTLAGVIQGSGSLTLNSDTLIISGTSNTYSGQTTIAGGTLQAGANNAFSSASAVMIDANATLSLGSYSNTIGGLLGSGSVTLQTPSVLTVNIASGSNTFSGSITGSGGLTVSGGGTLVLSATLNANTYSGATSITAGTLEAEANSLSTSSAVTISSGAYLQISGANQIPSLSGSGNVTLDDTLTIESDLANTFSGVIQGTGGLTFSGSGSLSLSAVSTYSGDTNINGGALYLTGSGTLSSASVLTMQENTIFDISAVTTSASIGTLSSTGENINLNLGSKTLTITQAAFGSFTGSIAGTTGSLVKAGSSTLQLAGSSNTYSGTTTISAGTLQAGAQNSFSAGSAVTLANVLGATLDLNGFSNEIASIAGGGTTGGSITLGSSEETILTLGNDNSSTSFGGVISGTGGIVKIGTGTLTLTGSNTYAGSMTISEGVITAFTSSSLSPSASVTVNSGAELDLNDGISASIQSLSGSGTVSLGSSGGASLTISNGGGLTFSGEMFGGGGSLTLENGTLILSGTLIGYTGSTTIQSGGTLQAGSPNCFSYFSSALADGTLNLHNYDNQIGGLSGGGSVLLGSGRLLIGNSSSTTNTFSGTITDNNLRGGLTWDSPGTLQFSGTSNGNIYSGLTIILEGTLQSTIANGFSPLSAVILSSTATLDLASNNNRIGGLSGSGSVTLGSGMLTIGGSEEYTFSGVITGTGGLILDSLGSLTLSEAQSYAGSTSLIQGALILTGSGSIEDSASVTILNGAILNCSDLATATIHTLSGDGQLILGSDAFTLIQEKDEAFSGGITGTGSFTKEGANTLTLYGVSNTYSGQTTIAAGILQAGTAGSLSPHSAVTLDNVAEASLNLNGFDNQIPSISGGGTSGGDLNLESGSLILTASGDYTFAGSITGTGNITKQNSGTLTLSGASPTYTGMTTLNSGQITLSNSQGLGTGALVMVNNTTLSLGSSILAENAIVMQGACTVTVPAGSATLSGVISGEAELTTRGGGTLNLSGVNTYTGKTNIAQGTLSLEGEASIASSSSVSVAVSATLDISGVSSATIQNLTGSGMVLIGNAELDLTQSASTTFAGTIAGLGPVTITGSYLDLAGSNTYTGVTTVEGSTILAVNGGLVSATTIKSRAILKGTGAIFNTVTIKNGATLWPGNSIGEITVTDLVLESGSTEVLEISAVENSVISIDNALTVLGPSSLQLVIEPGSYVDKQSYTVMTYLSETGGGNLSVSNNYPLLFTSNIVVDPDSIVVELSYTSPVTHAPLQHKNALAIAHALETVFKGNNPETVDLLSLFALSPEEFATALQQIDPAFLKGLTILQENNGVQVAQALLNHTRQMQSGCAKKEDLFHVWGSAFGDWISQDSVFFAGSPQVGYHTNSTGAILGVDYHLLDMLYVGVLGGYSQSYIHWQEEKGKASVQSGYIGVYGSMMSKIVYGNLSVVGDLNHYETRQSMVFGENDATAGASHGGSQLISHADTGVNLSWKGIQIRPFDSFDYLIQREGGFTEKGAGAFDLKINKTHATFLRNELGLNLAKCFTLRESTWSFSPTLSWVREIRIGGKGYTAEFVGTDVPFQVTGYVPNRSLFHVGALLTGQFFGDLLKTSIYYSGEFGSHYSNNSCGGEISVGF
jgi:fibronectin-binding autotransporter adhesin